MRQIKLSMIFPDLNPEDYKLFFAKRARNGVEPLDVYKKGIEEWERWISYTDSKDWFTRKYVFSLISLYPEEDIWLFGGVWELVSTDWRKSHPYEIKQVKRFRPFVGRLKIKCQYYGHSSTVYMEKLYSEMIVKEIMDEPYYTDAFPGYENVDISFEALQSIIKKRPKEWVNALSAKGIYLITDTKSGKRYVGKADGERGIWQRWKCYIRNGHGGDVDLKDLVKNKDFDYVQQYYKFTILEIVSGDEVDKINQRESYWKEVLLTRREKFGHNKN